MLSEPDLPLGLLVPVLLLVPATGGSSDTFRATFAGLPRPLPAPEDGAESVSYRSRFLPRDEEDVDANDSSWLVSDLTTKLERDVWPL